MAAAQTKICIKCQAEFVSFHGKPGLIGECERCGRKTAKARDPEMLGGNLVWSHKTAPELEIKTLKEARRFARLTARFGAGVTKCLVEAKEPAQFRDGGLDGFGRMLRKPVVDKS